MHHRAALATTLTAAVLLLSGCGAADWTTPRPDTTAVGMPATGFAPSASPSPEATVTPASGSWEGVSPSPGYRVVLLTRGADETTATLAAAVTAWAAAESVDLRGVDADGDAIRGIVQAMELNPELIVTVGEDLIDPLATVTPNHLEVPFLVLGAELAEPTANVTAVEWTGAGFRGSGLGSATQFDPESFTPERGADAIRAGVAAVLTGMTGVVLWIE